MITLQSSSVRLGAAAADKTNGVLPFKLHAGMRWSPQWSTLSEYFSDVSFYFDYRDIFDFWLYPQNAINPVLHLSLGTELRMLEILSVRAGIGEGLPSAGLGVDLNFAKLNLAMYGSEQSIEPGLQPVYNVILGLEFRY